MVAALGAVVALAERPPEDERVSIVAPAAPTVITQAATPTAEPEAPPSALTSSADAAELAVSPNQEPGSKGNEFVLPNYVAGVALDGLGSPIVAAGSEVVAPSATPVPTAVPSGPVVAPTSTPVPPPAPPTVTPVPTAVPVIPPTATPQPTTPAAPTATPPPTTTPADTGEGPTAEQWLALRMCESGNRYDINTGNGYYGAYQFAAATWRSLALRYYPDLADVLPHEASPGDQDKMALKLWELSGWSPWPACSARL